MQHPEERKWYHRVQSSFPEWMQEQCNVNTASHPRVSQSASSRNINPRDSPAQPLSGNRVDGMDVRSLIVAVTFAVTADVAVPVNLHRAGRVAVWIAYTVHRESVYCTVLSIHV